MPAISLAESTAWQHAAAVVLTVAKGSDGPVPLAGGASVDEALGGRLADALAAVGFAGGADEVVKIPTLGLAPFPVLVVTGVGAINGAPNGEQVRRAVGAALRADIGGAVHVLAGDGPLAAAAAEGALLGAYRFTAYKSERAKSGVSKLTVGVTAPTDRTAKAAVRRAQTVAEAVNNTRDLVNTPPNDLYPDSFANRAKEIGDKAGLDVEILNERQLKRGGFGGILGVGQGSARPPRLVRLTYRPARTKAKVALIGKGITFDSGGLNIKTQHMSWMKSDMGGAAAVINTIAAAAALKLPLEIVATVPMAENLPSGTSYRPSDVLTLRGGKTVEVADTDAEGRIILADAIARAIEDEPDYLLETSTLTGAQMVALGPKVIGAMGEPALRDRVVSAGTSAGELSWAMPLPEELRGGLDSQVADLQNVPGERWGSMLVGGLFLADFVPDGLPWVHLDIAGPSFNTGAAWGYTPKGGTGAVVRTLLATLEDLAGQGV